MKIQNNKTQKISKTILTKACFAASGALFLAGSIGMTYNLTQASAAEYSLAGGSVVLDGTNDGSATATLKTSVARVYVAAQGDWSIHEVVESEATQTSYLSLSKVELGESIATNLGTDGRAAWTPLDGNGVSIPASGNVLTATYTVDKDTPAGTYKISFSNGIFMYDENGVDVDEEDTIASDATITVTRDETSGGDNNENNNNENNDPEDGSASAAATESGDDTSSDGSSSSASVATSSSSSKSTSGLAVPDTGRMTQDGNGASAVAISIASVIASAVLFIIAVRTKNHKKIKFNKA